MNNNTIERIVQLRKQGVEYKEIAKELNVSYSAVRRHCKNNGLTKNGVPSSIADREKNFADKLNASQINFEYVGEFINQDKPMVIRCTICGLETTRNGVTIRQAMRGLNTLACSACKSNESKVKKESRKGKDDDRQLRKRVLKKVTKMKTTLKEMFVCRCVECGSAFGSGRRRSICSQRCINRRNNRSKELRKRRVKLNGWVDTSITIEKLIIKEKNVCYLCGGDCDSNDHTTDDKGSFIVGQNYPSIEHVIPVSKGGTHTWDNVKLAHHYCNSIKNDKKIIEETGQMVLMI